MWLLFVLDLWLISFRVQEVNGKIRKRGRGCLSKLMFWACNTFRQLALSLGTALSECCAVLSAPCPLPLLPLCLFSFSQSCGSWGGGLFLWFTCQEGPTDYYTLLLDVVPWARRQRVHTCGFPRIKSGITEDKTATMTIQEWTWRDSSGGKNAATLAWGHHL